jgi:hypothetical protein
MMRSLLLLSLCWLLGSACRVDPMTQTGWFKRTATTIGDIGGGTDSVALWLAIILLFLLPVTALAGALVYQHILRPRRIVRENSKHNGNGL